MRSSAFAGAGAFIGCAVGGPPGGAVGAVAGKKNKINVLSKS